MVKKNKTIEHGEIYKENLKTTLTDPELRAYGRELAEKLIDHEQIDAERKGYVSDLKARMDIIQARLNALSLKVSSQCEWREVDAQWTLNFGTGRKTLIRLDTGEIVKELAVTDTDRQRYFKLEEKKDVKKKTDSKKTDA